MPEPLDSHSVDPRSPTSLAGTLAGRLGLRVRVAWAQLSAWFDTHPPELRYAIWPALLASLLIYSRNPLSNYIFDEQEALLGNPYVNGVQKLKYWDAFRRDFWGLPPDRSIGSYRPIPNLVWRLLWHVSHEPFVHHLVNVAVHALNATLLASFSWALFRERRLAWLIFGCFLCCATLTEAVTGVVGIADVFGGLGTLLALLALRLPLYGAPLAIFGALLLGLFSKESAIDAVPLVAWAALVTAPLLHPKKPLAGLRAGAALLASVAALVLYTELRRKWFLSGAPAPLLPEISNHASWPERALHTFLRWFAQPKLPGEFINNPLIDATFPQRVAGALRVYFRGFTQILCPLRLSGEYSFAAEPIPTRLIFFESVAGALLFVLPPLCAVAAWLWTLVKPSAQRLDLRVLVALGGLWFPLAYFPHSNIPILLPTVRAERFWYLPAIGTACLIGAAFYTLLRRNGRFARVLVSAFFAFQIVSARSHALDYTDDLIFWRATKNASPQSAKAHLNYSVMLGARGKLEERLAENRIALGIAPRWPMAHIYLGDTLCRLHRSDEAWSHYVSGFELAPNDLNLIALALQCLWDEKNIEPHQAELLGFADKHPGSWLAYLANDIVANGAEHQGVQKKYRPRAYDEGPKSD